MVEEGLTVVEVRSLALAARVARDVAYHADAKGFRFEDIVGALAWCFRVESDARVGAAGAKRNPRAGCLGGSTGSRGYS